MSVGVRYDVFIGDKSYNKLCRIDYTFLQYSIVMRAISQAYVVMQNQSPQAAAAGVDFLQNAYTLIIEREGVEKFRGEIDLVTTPGKETPLGVDKNEAYGTLDRIGLNASSILQRMADVVTIPDVGSTSYRRTFDGVSYGAAITTLIGEVIAYPNSPVASLTIGTVESPTDRFGNTLTLTTDQALYGYSYLDWIRVLGDLGDTDWYLEGSQFNFLRQKGIDRRDSVVFSLIKGNRGNNLTGITLNVDRQQMVNHVMVVGAQEGYNQVVRESVDSQSIANFGLRQRVIPIRVLDNATTAQQYAESYVKRQKQNVPVGAFSIYPDQQHELFGSFQIGDTVGVNVDIDTISFQRAARVMGAVVTVEQIGLERIYYDLQEPTA